MPSLYDQMSRNLQQATASPPSATGGQLILVNPYYTNRRVLNSTAKAAKTSTPAKQRTIAKVVNASSDQARSTTAPPLIQLLIPPPNSAPATSLQTQNSPANLLGDASALGSTAPIQQAPNTQVSVEITEQAIQQAPIVTPAFGPTPSNPTTISRPLPGSMNAGEQFFSASAPLTLALSSDISESYTGLMLEQSEKPKIIANVVQPASSGFSRKNVLIARKMITNRATVVEYRLFRKDARSNDPYEKIKTLTTEEASLPTELSSLVASLGYQPAQTFIFEDVQLSQSTIYLYKIEVVWTLSLLLGVYGGGSTSTGSVAAPELIAAPFFFGPALTV